jgi:uncharacterized protein
MTHPSRSSPTEALTLSGVRIDLAAPDPDDIRVEDLAQALSQACRFGNQPSRFYSVAEHALFVAALVEAEHPDRPDLIEAALHHDDYKAYTGDLLPAVRVLCGEAYTSLVARLKPAIAASIGFDVDLLEHPAVIAANDRATAIEAAHLQEHPAWDWTRPDGRPPIVTDFTGGIDSETARIAWLSRANDLRRLDISPFVS